MTAFRTLSERPAGWLAVRLARRCNDRDLMAEALQDAFILLPGAIADQEWPAPGRVSNHEVTRSELN